MADYPIPQDYDRHIDPISDEPEENVPEIDLFDEEPEIEELADGSAIVRLDDFKTPEEEPDFYANLVETFSYEADTIAFKLLGLIEKDKDARKERDKQYEEGLRRTGLGNDAPGGAQFTGASKVVHPVMAEACVDFASRAIKELFPPEGPVKTKMYGEVTDEKTARAERKKEYMNWQLTEQIEEYRDEEEQLLTQLPLGGSQYMKISFDDRKRRPFAEFVPIDNIYLPYAAVNFYTSPRVTEVQYITEDILEERIRQGLYVDINIIRVSQEPEQSKSAKANDKIEGKESDAYNPDNVRTVYHVYTWLELEDDPYSKGERAPYIVMIDELSQSPLGIYRNWEFGDETLSKLDWLVEFKFIPWRGAYAVGLPHLIGGLAGSLTGALRALLDSAHINNVPAMLKLKGGKISGQSLQIDPTQVAEIEGAPGVDDIRKIAMPLPFNPPSPVLFQLLGWLTDAAKGVVTTAEEKIADVTANAPVGTTQALIEQGAAVFSAIHARLHESQKRVLRIIARLNRWYLNEQIKGDIIEDIPVTPEDFEKNSDIVPVSDPNIFAETQRYAQIQTLAARAQANPDLYNRLAVEKRILKQIKLPDVDEVLPDPEDVKDMNPALENVAMTLAKPVGAFPNQDHISHLMVHLQYASDPMYGSNPIMAQSFLPACLEHIKQHFTLWYLNQMDSIASASLDKPFNGLKVQPIMREAQQLLAATSNLVHLEARDQLGQFMPIMQQMLQMVQKFQQQPPVDPNVQLQAQTMAQTSMAETQRKAQKDQADNQFRQAQLQADMATKERALQQQMDLSNAKNQTSVILNTDDNLTQERIKSAEISNDSQRLQNEQIQTSIDAQNAIQSTLGGNNGQE